MHQNCYLKIFPHGLGAHWWRHKALEGWCCLKNLPSFEADIILNIPLSYSLPDDQIIWIGNKKGEFFVRSAYYVALPIIHPFNESESSRDDPHSPLWKRMWHFNVPTKIKIFAWCACMNALPTMHFLRTRGVSTDGICPVCDLCPESTLHALIHCDTPKEVWSNWLNCPVD